MMITGLILGDPFVIYLVFGFIVNVVNNDWLGRVIVWVFHRVISVRQSRGVTMGYERLISAFFSLVNVGSSIVAW